MAKGSDRKILIGTIDGLYEAVENGSSWNTRLLGLQGTGIVRYPVIDAEDPRRLYAGTSLEGMFRSEDGGVTWQEINRGILYKEIFSVAQNPKTYELYVGTQPASVFKSTNGGDSFAECVKLKQLKTTKEWTFPNPPHVAHVKHIDVTPDAPGRVLGAVEEGWLVRSDDDGENWINITEHVEFDSHTVTSIPGQPDHVLSTSGQGFFRSEDGGVTWEESMEGLDCRYMTHVAVSPKRPELLYTAAAAVPPPGWRRPEGAAAAIYRSENQGKSWQRLRGGLPDLITAAPRGTAIDPEDPEVFFVGMTDGSVWMSEDGGESLKQVITGLPGVQTLTFSHR